MGAAGGERVGRFRVVSRLGLDVLLGEDENGRQVVVRLLPGVGPERFRQDVRRAAAAPPWFAAPVLDADPDADPPWIATAHVPGPTLARYVTEHGPLGDEGVFALATRMLDGLVALHRAGVVHHHLDPGTVVLADDGPRVTDTGLTGLPATPGYRAPEADGPGAGAPVDMYALGALLVHAATGRAPVVDPTGEPDLTALTGRVRDGVLGCLQADPTLRPTAAQLREYLLAGLEEETPPQEPEIVPGIGQDIATEIAAHRAAAGLPGPPSTPGWERTRPARRVPVVAGIALVAALIAGAFLVVLGLRDNARPAGPGPAVAAVPTFTPPHSRTTAPGTSAPPADPAADAVVVDAGADPRFTATQARFVSPSRNITCTLTDGRARCDVVQREWTEPPPAGCATDATGAQLTGTGAVLACGPAPAATGAVLEYGTGVRLGDLVCASQETGMACRSASGHGFRVSRGSVSLY
ncbi:serine/threonine protein kinase [Pseudonocardia sp. CA-107938]|uniref:serine/threonine protein kinase n=1 Tax=Pseudonocardia sp. CA-107938 TaxID=3240021 RepID=UPI003D9243D6